MDSLVVLLVATAAIAATSFGGGVNDVLKAWAERIRGRKGGF